MKNVFRSVFALAAIAGIALIFSSCEKEKEDPIVITIQATIPEATPGLDMTQLSLILTDRTQGTTQKGTFVMDGQSTALATFYVSAGSYSVSISGSGIIIGDEEVNVNGVAENFLVTRDAITSETGTIRKDMLLPVDLSVSVSSRIIIRQVYVSGTTTTAGANYTSDMFIELYNNGTTDYYLDSLCIATINPMNAHASSSWSTVANEKLALAFHKWMIPGSGKDYKLAPGKAAVFAPFAINHTGTTRAVDLSHADFQFYAERFTGGNLTAGIPVMTEIIDQPAGIRWVYSQMNPAFIIFRFPNFDYYIANKDSKYLEYEPGTTKSAQYVIPSKWVIDGVELFQQGRNNMKRLPSFIDAGNAMNNASYQGTGVRRKLDTAKTATAGHNIYTDTNNSSNDFEAAVCAPWAMY